MVAFWKFRAWLHYWLSKLIWLAIMVGLIYLVYLAVPKILAAWGFIDKEMGM